ncbi:MAG: hypothetical protein HYV94_03485 [Candidatus Rokubacteria bacterium]|nr:hypothetical protein [Candidatus Rokubacteria bacterium]
MNVIVRKDSPFARTEFERRQRQPILPARDACFARPEDVIAGILRISGAELDLAHVSAWAERLGVADLWDAVQRRASGR